LQIINHHYHHKFLITPRIYAAGDFKTGPESVLRDSMSEEAKINLAFYEPLWAKWKNFVYENRNDDMQWVDGNNNDRVWGGKQRVLNNINWFKNYFDYVSFNDTEGAYHDYEENKRSGNWVYSWFNVYGIHKNTGVKLDHPVLRLYALNKDNSKILRIVEYSNKIEFNRIWDARPQTSRENGKIYINHDNINSVRKAMYSFFNGDMDKAWSFFHENATFEDINEIKVMRILGI